MHEYSAENTQRPKVVFRIALLSFILTPIINTLLIKIFVKLQTVYQITYTITSVSLFSILYFSFNRWGWRLFDKFLKIPNLNGIWRCKGVSRNYHTKEKFDWTSEIHINQEWDKIGITQKTKESESFSTSIIGGLKIEDDGCVLLSYVYSNTPRSSTPALQKHEGLVKLRFNKDLRRATGDYFNDQDRMTYGTMVLEKIK